MTAGTSCRYFISYTGVSLPLKLVNEITEQQLENRITYFKGYYEDGQRLRKIEKVVYGEIEFTHDYEYDTTGNIRKAVLVADEDDVRTLIFDEFGSANEA